MSSKDKEVQHFTQLHINTKMDITQNVNALDKSVTDVINPDIMFCVITRSLFPKLVIFLFSIAKGQELGVPTPTSLKDPVFFLHICPSGAPGC